MSSFGIKNWHWRTKGVERWAKTYWQDNLVGLETGPVKITALDDVEGDAELGMRKSKLVTIYDQKLTLSWATLDATASGKIVAPEVSHDMEEDEYVFNVSSADASDDVIRTVKTDLCNLLRKQFQLFPKAIIATHGKDLLQEAEDGAAADAAASAAAAGSGTTPAPVAAAAKPAATSTPAATSKAPFNTATVRASGEFQCSASDLFDFLTNEAKIPLWARSPATMKPEVGAQMKLFGGNVEGTVTAVTPPSALTTTWRAPTWPENYHGTLFFTLSQGSNSTTLDLRLEGVPVGLEDEAERNLNGYYINGLRQIGYVSPYPLYIAGAAMAIAAAAAYYVM